jgi:hypothetical protein
MPPPIRAVSAYANDTPMTAEEAHTILRTYCRSRARLARAVRTAAAGDDTTPALDMSAIAREAGLARITVREYLGLGPTTTRTAITSPKDGPA